MPTWTEGTALAKSQDRSRSWGRQSALASPTLFLEHSLADPGARAQNQVGSSHSLISQLPTDFLGWLLILDSKKKKCWYIGKFLSAKEFPLTALSPLSEVCFWEKGR